MSWVYGKEEWKQMFFVGLKNTMAMFWIECWTNPPWSNKLNTVKYKNKIYYFD
jgi:hypothetical protein